MRTQEQILTKINGLGDSDWMGTITSDLLVYLDYENAKPFLKPETTKEEWNKIGKKFDKTALLEEMRSYMTFAWGKANDCRGLSAGRTMDHYTAWVWLLGDEDVFGDLQNYTYYGKLNLIKICKYYGWNDLLALDDGERVN